MSKLIGTLFISGSLWVLCACGGGGNSTAPSNGNNNTTTPAQVGGLWAGVWTGTTSLATGLSDHVVVELHQAGSTLTGYATIPFVGLYNAALTGTVSGNTFSFGDINHVIQYTGALNSVTTAQGTYHESMFGTDGTWFVRQLKGPFSDTDPLSVPGDWSIVSVSSMGAGTNSRTASISQNGADLSGTVAGYTIVAGRVSGDVAWFTITTDATTNSIAVGTFGTSTASGTYLANDAYASSNPVDQGTWSATKN